MLREIMSSEPAVATPALSAPPGIGGGEILSLGASMIIIVGIIVVLGWFYSRSRFMAGGASDVINVVASRPLGPKERLMVVEVAGQQLLVGMTAAGVQTLYVLDKPVHVPAKDNGPAGFAGRLRAAFQEIAK